MPDLRDDLGRLADFVGEPRGLDDLAAVRRRREGRRRAEGLVAGLAVAIAVALFAVTTLRSDPSPVVPVGTPSTSVDGGPENLTVWPENAINGVSARDVQTAVDAGDPDLQWRTDPMEVVDRFGLAVFGRHMAAPTDEGISGTIRAWPCPPGERPGIGLSCDALQGDPLVFSLVQPARTGDGGIWSIASITSQPLSILGETGTATSLPAGGDVRFDLRLYGAGGHIGILASNGCRTVSANDDPVADGQYTLALPSAGPSEPPCPAVGAGYAFAYATDDTTLPTPDPMNEPTAIEYPWITIVPISLQMDVEGSAGPSSTAPTAVETDCGSGTDITVVGKDISLTGCTSWTAGEPIDIRFDVRDEGIPMGLALFSPSSCDQNGCVGKALWTGELVVGRDTTTYHLDPLHAGSYVLMDQVHPTARLEIAVG